MCGYLLSAFCWGHGLQPGMWPDWELNRQCFGSQTHAQSTELHQPGLQKILMNSGFWLQHTILFIHMTNLNLNIKNIDEYNFWNLGLTILSQNGQSHKIIKWSNTHVILYISLKVEAQIINLFRFVYASLFLTLYSIKNFLP